MRLLRRLSSVTGVEPGSITMAATGGAVWMGGSLIVQVSIGIVAQVVLAAILDPREFGLFALVVSTSYLLHSLGNFGIKTLMSQRTAGEIDALHPAIYPAGLVAATLSGLALVAIAPVVSGILDEPELTALLVVTASTFLLKPQVAIALATLQARLQFVRVAWATLAATVAYYVVAIVLASRGWGAMSLVVGTQVNVAVLSLSLWVLSGIAPWDRGDPSIREMSPGRAALAARWATAGEVAMDTAGRIDFLMLGLFVPTPIVGLYYFAYQLVTRLNELLTGVTRNVLFPALAQIPGGRERQSAGVIRAGNLLVLVGSTIAAGLIATVFAIEQILWDGRWAAAVPAMMILASVAPGQAALSAVEQLLKARAHFKRWTALIGLRTVVGALVAISVGAAFGEAATATRIAVAIGVFLAVDAIGEVLVIADWVGMPGLRYWSRLLPIWVGLVSVGWIVDSLIGDRSWSPWLTVLAGGSLVLAVGGALTLVLWRTGHLLPRSSSAED